MKKRAMKKWIPKNTPYCHTVKGIVYGTLHINTCKWWRKSSKHDEQLSGYCMYLGIGDWHSPYMSLLWDQCKECGVSED